MLSKTDYIGSNLIFDTFSMLKWKKVRNFIFGISFIVFAAFDDEMAQLLLERWQLPPLLTAKMFLFLLI